MMHDFEWFKNLGTPQGMADLAAELDAGYVAGMCIICKSRRDQPHDQTKHDFYDKTVTMLKQGITFGFSDGTEETVVLCDDGVLRPKEETPSAPQQGSSGVDTSTRRHPTQPNRRRQQ